MRSRIGYSSEIYNVEVQDIAHLENLTSEIKIKIKNAITVLVSDKCDMLVCGRELLDKAIAEGQSHVPVQFVFNMRYPMWKVHITFIKKLRDKKRIKGSGIYHIVPQELRQLGIERAYRGLDNAHQHAAAQEHPDSENLYDQLTKSLLDRGYDDNYPMDLQLCRSLGVQDTLNQGHHRMGAMIENDIRRASIRFSAVGYIPNPFRWVLLKLAKEELKKKRKNS